MFSFFCTIYSLTEQGLDSAKGKKAPFDWSISLETADSTCQEEDGFSLTEHETHTCRVLKSVRNWKDVQYKDV